MKQNMRLVFAEVVLLLASVFIFRSVWLLIDMFSIMHDARTLWISFLLALVVAIPALRYIIRHRRSI